jgi:prophage regulatory protein
MLKTRNGDTGNVPGERLVRMKELRVLTGLGRSTIHRLVAEGRFPKQLHPFNNNLAAWRWSEVQAWVEARCKGEAVYSESEAAQRRELAKRKHGKVA